MHEQIKFETYVSIEFQLSLCKESVMKVFITKSIYPVNPAIHILMSTFPFFKANKAHFR